MTNPTPIAHTPGPWRVKTSGNVGNTVEASSGRKMDDLDNGFRHVASFQACGPADADWEEERANAAANGALIAAAPSLLAALETIIGQSGNRETIRICRAAIALARGDHP